MTSTPTTETSEDFSDDLLTDEIQDEIQEEIQDEITPGFVLPSTSGPTLDSYHAVVTAFIDFLTVAIHTILYERNLYPRTSFLRARKYDYPVRQSRHPNVCEWIVDALTAVEAELIKSVVSNVSLLIHTNTNPSPIERFVFSMAMFPYIPLGQSHSILSPPLSFSDLSAQFAAVLSRLSVACGKLPPLPGAEVGDCSFTIAIEMRHGVPRKMEGWIPAVMGLQPDDTANNDAAREDEQKSQDDERATQRSEGGKGDRGQLLGGERSLPIRAVELGRFVMEVWVEEAKKEETKA